MSDSQARPELPLQSRVRYFHLKAVECHQLADNAQYPETKRIYRDLALTYEQVAIHLERMERHIPQNRILRT